MGGGGVSYCPIAILLIAKLIGTTMKERRRHLRSDISSEAFFFFGSSGNVLHGAALNISGAGASLALDRFYALPRNLLLSFDHFNTGQSCRVVWSRGNFLGVEFEPAKLPVAKDTPEKAKR
jgi:PilZ domain-containing protein